MRKEIKIKKVPEQDWTRLDAMTDEEVHAAALSDPDAQPMTEEELRQMKPRPHVRIIRRALNMSQQEFAARFHIPLGTLRDWEQWRKIPDAAARAYLKVIITNPNAVAEALESKPAKPRPNSPASARSAASHSR
jgi:putative transcriptional regulator